VPFYHVTQLDFVDSIQSKGLSPASMRDTAPRSLGAEFDCVYLFAEQVDAIGYRQWLIDKCEEPAHELVIFEIEDDHVDLNRLVPDDDEWIQDAYASAYRLYASICWTAITVLELDTSHKQMAAKANEKGFGEGRDKGTSLT
jgi:hypothetical protein